MGYVISAAVDVAGMQELVFIGMKKKPSNN